MQVAHILRKFDPAEWGGTETAVQRLCDGLRAHDVTSIAFCPQLESDLLEDPLTRSGHRVRRFKACVPVWGISEQNRRAMVAVGGNLLSFDLLWDLWREPKVDIVHVHTGNRLGGIGLTVSRWRGIPMVAQVHGGALDLPAVAREALEAPRRGGVEWGRVFGAPLRSRRVLECADAVIVCNQVEAKLLRERYPRQRVFTLPHGVPASEYARDRRLEARQAFPIAGRPMFLMAGRIDRVKNQHWVVEQFAGVIRRHPAALLVIAGSVTDPPYAEDLRQTVAKLGLEKNVLFTGALPSGDPRLAGLFQEARALILPSVSETFGLVILEAWASGRPVLSSRTSGALGLVREGENGCLFDLAAPEQFHRAIDGFLAAPDRASAMGDAGRRLVKSDYDTIALAGRVKGLYQELIHARRK